MALYSVHQPCWHRLHKSHLAAILRCATTLLPHTCCRPTLLPYINFHPLCCHTPLRTHLASTRRLETAFRTSKSRNRQARQASRFSSFISSITIGAILPKAQRPLAQHISTRTRRFHTHYTRHMHYTLYVHAPAQAREGRLAIKKSGRGTMSYAPPRLTECRSSNRAPPNFPRQFSFFVIPFFPSSFQS